MKPTLTFAKAILCVLFAIVMHPSSFAQQTLSISNVWELYTSLGSNKILELDTGVYNLNVLLDQQYANEKLPTNPKGAELIHVNNLTLKGKSYGRTMIVVSPAYGWTVYFRNCKNIQLSNITFGHIPSGHCRGGVLKFVGCSEVNINHCDLFGSGTVGLALDSCSDFQVNESTIHDCTRGLADLYTSHNIRFNQVNFKNTLGGIFFMNTPDVYFTKCDFENNDATKQLAFFSLCQDYDVMDDIHASEEDLNKKITVKTKVYIDSCSVRNNTFPSFTNDRRRLSINGTKMEKNTISKE